MKLFNKKTLLIASLFFFFCTKVFAIGAGFSVSANPTASFNLFSANPSTDFNFSADVDGSLRFSRIPLVLAFGGEIALPGSSLSNNFGFGVNLNCDYWFIDTQIYNTWSFYSGAGLALNFLYNTINSFSFSSGIRFFAGVNVTFLDNYIEYFVQLNAVPQFTVCTNSYKDFSLKFPVETGLRFHF